MFSLIRLKEMELLFVWSFAQPVYRLFQNTYISLNRDELEFPRERLQLGVDLGEGRFGKVIQARAMNISGTRNWEKVAVKTCRGKIYDSTDFLFLLWKRVQEFFTHTQYAYMCISLILFYICAHLHILTSV